MDKERRQRRFFGLVTLSKLVHLFQNNSVGLYQDDGLGVLRVLPGLKTKRLRKNVVKIFKSCALTITSKTNLKIVDYLHVTFYLRNNGYKPYRKPDNLPVRIQKHSNYSAIVLNE